MDSSLDIHFGPLAFSQLFSKVAFSDQIGNKQLGELKEKCLSSIFKNNLSSCPMFREANVRIKLKEIE